MSTPPKMTWEKSSAALVDLFTGLAPEDPQVEQKKMFGWPCCFVNGNLFAGLHKESMIFRLSQPDAAPEDVCRVVSCADAGSTGGPRSRGSRLWPDALSERPSGKDL